MILLILWRRVDNCNTIECICDTVSKFKQYRFENYHIFHNNPEYYWTKEAILD